MPSSSCLGIDVSCAQRDCCLVRPDPTNQAQKTESNPHRRINAASWPLLDWNCRRHREGHLREIPLETPRQFVMSRACDFHLSQHALQYANPVTITAAWRQRRGLPRSQKIASLILAGARGLSRKSITDCCRMRIINSPPAEMKRAWSTCHSRPLPLLLSGW